MTEQVKIRQRATAILKRADEILLLRVHDDDFFHLPGGGVEDGELAIAAVARELYEETALEATSIAYLFQHSGKSNNHHVFRVTADGEVNVATDLDVVEHTWWDRNGGVSVYPHVTDILNRLSSELSGEN